MLIFVYGCFGWRSLVFSFLKHRMWRINGSQVCLLQVQELLKAHPDLVSMLNAQFSRSSTHTDKVRKTLYRHFTIAQLTSNAAAHEGQKAAKETRYSGHV